MRKLLTYAIPVILGVGVLAALVSNPSEEGQFSASRGVTEEQPFGLPAVIEEPTTSTTTTTAPPAAQPTTPATFAPTPTTTARPVSTKPPAPKPAATPRPAPQPAPGPPAPDCGTGSAQAKVALVATGPGTRYRLVATVTNNASKAVELDRLVVQAVYGGVNQTFTANVAGRKIEPGAQLSIEIPESDSASPPSNSPQITEFAFHTAGLPECASS